MDCNKLEINSLDKIKVIPLEENKYEPSLGLCGRWSGLNNDVNTHFINNSTATNNSQTLANYYK